VRRPLIAVSAILLAGAAVLAGAGPASAHVVPSTVLALDVHQHDITTQLTLPTTDLVTASGIAIPENGRALSAAGAAKVSAYVEKHFRVTTGDDTWKVSVTDVVATATEQYGTGEFPAVTATATLTPTDQHDLRSFTIDYTAIIHEVISADIYVTLNSDWAAGQLDSARTLGTITLDTVTGTIPTLHVNLDDGSLWQGFTGMVALGISHIAQGTDHQLFLLTLLLPAPLLAVRRRWSAVVTPRRAVRHILAITIAFTIGHSVTLALGTLGLPVPQQPIEAAIAASILVAAAHAIRPLFPGREPLIAGLFGLIHGLAFSATLSALHLTGSQLVLSLLGFNLGIELMQLTVVLLVLPPLVVLARTVVYRPLRLVAASVTAVAAAGWLVDRVGVPNAVGTAANSLGQASVWIVLVLWVGAAVALVLRRRRAGADASGVGGPDRRKRPDPAAVRR
jgi:HupE / UreJ protein